MKNEHQCIIGILHYCDDSVCSTEKEIVDYVKNNNELYDNTEKRIRESIRMKRFKLSDFFDKRKGTSLERFDYCPRCGKKIDWKKIRERNKENE